MHTFEALLKKAETEAQNQPFEEENTFFVDVILPLHIPRLYTYRVARSLANEIEIGKRVIVPIKKKFYTGIIAKIHNNSPENYTAKYIEEILDAEPIVNPLQLKFWQWMANYYLCYTGDVMQAALPASLKLGSETYISLHPQFDFEYSNLNDKEYLIAEALSTNAQLSIKEVIQILNQKTVFPIIKSLVEKRVILASEAIIRRYKVKKEIFVKLNPKLHNEEQLRALFDFLERAPKQLEVLMTYLHLRKNYDWIKQGFLAKEAKSNTSFVKTLIEKEIFLAEERAVDRLKVENLPSIETKIELSSAQEKAFLEIKNQFQKQDAVLLHGVTSSGKTLVYVKLIEEMIQQGKEVLYLVPEIALTTQLIARLRYYFKDKIGIYHSRFNDNERAEIWHKVLQKKYQVVMGVRSSIFLPFSNLGLIVVDEEHEQSYKQHEPTPRYQARDSALVLAKMQGAKTLLGSATPSIETYYNALNKKFGLVNLSERFGGLKLPEIAMADVAKESREKTMKSHFTSRLINLIGLALEKKEQVILFQNRRGYVPVHECAACGWVPMCVNCDISLTYHKASHSLCCHYCGYRTLPVSACHACGSTNVQTKGFGTEKIEEQLNIYFPKANIARLDYDATRGKNAFERIILDFENRKIDVLIGTQMVTKGLDFDNVTLVGVLNADQAMQYPDFRAYERSFQLLSQVSGRAGRKFKQGLVIIQSRKVEHALFEYVKTGNYKAFYDAEMEQRSQYFYPPFCRLINIVLKHKDFRKVDSGAKELAQKLQSKLGNCVLGPAIPMIPRIRNQYIQEILIKIDPNKLSLSKVKSFIDQEIYWLKTESKHKAVKCIADVDA